MAGARNQVPLFPYQREGMLHLAFTERALLADEMGLGKTIQAIAACALLHRLGQARARAGRHARLAQDRVGGADPAVHRPAVPARLRPGAAAEGLRAARQRRSRTAGETPALRRSSPSSTTSRCSPTRWTSTQRLRPDIVVLDEAQRIKNWSTKTTQAIKRLRSRYAFVLTGTPIENRIDELYSLMDFLNPSVLGPLFRFNRDFYELDERGRPAGYRNLDQLHERIKPHMLRRRKADVETELPERTDRNHFVQLSAEQQGAYEDHDGVVARLANIAKRRPLTQQEQDKLLRHLAMMRMICDTNYILDPDQRACPKLAELEKILEECRDNDDVKVIVFSEWERMLELVRGLCAPAQARLRLAHRHRAAEAPPRRDQRLQERPELPRLPQHRFRRDRPEPAERQRRHQLRPAVEPGQARTAHRPRLAQAPDPRRHRHQPGLRKHHRAPHAGHALQQAGAGRRRARPQRRPQGDQAPERPAGLPGQAPANWSPSPPRARSPRRAKPKPPLPADRATRLCRRRPRSASTALCSAAKNATRTTAPHSVLYVVVERDAAQCREQLDSLHEEYFGPGQCDPLAPVRLEVIDRATDEALQRLIDAGLLAKTTRASRPLWPAEAAEAAPPPLSPAEQEKLAAHRQLAARKLKMARVLSDAALNEEARASLLEAVAPLGCALALQHRLPEPASLSDALLPPLSPCWKDALSLLRQFVADAAHPCRPVLEALTSLAQAYGQT